MRAYFKATRTSNEEKVMLECMFLADNAKLWWRTLCTWSDVEKVEMWEELTKELHLQFLLTITVWIARDTM